MSNQTDVIEAFNRFDYDVIEWADDHITVQSTHDSVNPRITVHSDPRLLSGAWVEQHFTDRMKVYLEVAYGKT